MHVDATVVSMTAKLPPLHHVGLIVSDFSAAAADFERRWGVETEDVMDLTWSEAVYDGTPSPFSARYGFLRSGASALELVQPLSGRSPYADFLEANGGDGIHHLAYVVDDIDAHLRQISDATGAPAEIQLDSPLPGNGRFTYVKNAAHGTVVELIELSEEQRQQM
jgi:methylmalonyl-CoA/ethylmalonyl-CoA epimerase